MRASVVAIVVLTSAHAVADDAPTSEVRARALRETAPVEPWLRLDALQPDPSDAEGGIIERRRAQLALGPRARMRGEGAWWQSGLAPSMFATDLDTHGWRARGELSYDLGWVQLGINASLARTGDSSHRMVGLFAYRTLRLSRWMHAWIVLGVAHERWDHADPRAAPQQGMTVGVSVGTTFR